MKKLLFRSSYFSKTIISDWILTTFDYSPSNCILSIRGIRMLNKLGVSPLLLGALGLSVKGANILTIPVWSWHAAKLIGDHTKYFQREGLDCWHFSPFWFVHLNNCQENKGPWKCSLYKASNHYYSSCSCFNLYPGQNQLNAVQCLPNFALKKGF